MKDRIKGFVRVALVVGVCIGGICLLIQHEGKADAPTHSTPPLSIDTTASVQSFLGKPAREGLKEALIYYKVAHPEIVYAQAVLETGNFKSVGCLKHHNLFGLYNSKARRYCRFRHWSESIIAYKERIQKRYKPPEDYYKFLQRIGYAEDPKYIHKLKQIVKSNDKRGGIKGGKGNS